MLGSFFGGRGGVECLGYFCVIMYDFATHLFFGGMYVLFFFGSCETGGLALRVSLVLHTTAQSLQDNGVSKLSVDTYCKSESTVDVVGCTTARAIISCKYLSGN